MVSMEDDKEIGQPFTSDTALSKSNDRADTLWDEAQNRLYAMDDANANNNNNNDSNNNNSDNKGKGKKKLNK